MSVIVSVFSILNDCMAFPVGKCISAPIKVNMVHCDDSFKSLHTFMRHIQIKEQHANGNMLTGMQMLFLLIKVTANMSVMS